MHPGRQTLIDNMGFQGFRVFSGFFEPCTPQSQGHWTQLEEYIICSEHTRKGPQWSLYESRLPGRTDCAIKNRESHTQSHMHKEESVLLHLQPDEVIFVHLLVTRQNGRAMHMP